MKMMNGFALICLSLSLSLVSCGYFSDDDDSVSNPGAGLADKDVFGLTGAEYTDVTGDQVSGFVNASNIVLVKPFEVVSVGTVSAAAATVSRDITPSAAFLQCIQTKIKNVGLQVTNDTISYDFSFDFIKDCDRTERPDDLVGEIKNTMKARVVFGCAGGGIENFTGKLVGDLDSARNLCADQAGQKVMSRKLFYEVTVDARKTFKVKNGTEYEVKRVQSKFSNSSLSAKSGAPCNLLVKSDTSLLLDSCRLVSQSRIFDGLPVNENKSPNSKTEPHPFVTQQVITVTGGVFEKTANGTAQFYSSADVTFFFNGWAGKMNFTNGWASPTWEATLGSAKRGGTYGVVETPNLNQGNGTVADEDKVAAPQKPTTIVDN